MPGNIAFSLISAIFRILIYVYSICILQSEPISMKNEWIYISSMFLKPICLCLFLGIFFWKNLRSPSGGGTEWWTSQFFRVFLPELWQIASNLNPPKECGIDCCAATQNWFLKYNNREREDRVLYKGANELTKRV